MSSATSINRPAERAGPAGPHGAGAVRADGFKPAHFFVLLSLLGATVAVVMARQPAPAQLVLLSVMIGTAGACAAALYAMLAPLVRAGSNLDRTPLSDRARAALEREKMLVLRSIKELEFDRAMGKISTGDFDEMAGRLRARALALMKQLDTPGSTYRSTIERELVTRVEQSAAAQHVCACGTKNDADASFCKRCGQRLRPESGRQP
jgi:ribosomal protein L40E